MLSDTHTRDERLDMRSPIILAVDTDDLEIASEWISATRDSIDVYKLGLEFFLKFGTAGVAELKKRGEFELFLDLKLHDIPNTVAGAVRSVKELSPKFLTVHAAGGSAMIRAAAQEAPAIEITGVTVLTSLSESSLLEMGIELSPLDYALALGSNATQSGARALVCSPLEVEAMRALLGDNVTLITPGVRPADSELGDQSRVLTPQEALSRGANYLVIGRPITSYYSDSRQAMSERAAQILESLGK